MTKQEKKEEVIKKLKQEPNKYFVPEFGHVEADDLSDVEQELKKLKEKQEDGDDGI